MTPIRLAFFLACVLASAPLLAEPLDLKALYERARERSEDIGMAEALRSQASARHREALGEWLPQVTLKAGHGFADKGNRELQSPSLRLNARQDLLSGLDQPAAMKGGEAALVVAKAGVAQAERDLMDEVGKAYFDVQSLEEEHATQGLLLKAVQDAAAELKKRVSLGRNRQAELSSAEAQVARVQALVANLEGQRSQAREALASLCAVPVDQVLAPLALPAPAGTEALDGALDRLPEVIAARWGVKVAEAGKLAQQGRFLPSLFAEGNWHAARQGGVSGPDWDAAIGLDLPIFQGGAQLARLDAAKAGLLSAGLRLKKAEREALRELKQAGQGLTQALSRAEATRLSLEAAEKSYADQQKDFRNSLVTSLDLLNALQSVENARLEALRARFDTHRAALRLKLASGQPLP